MHRSLYRMSNFTLMELFNQNETFYVPVVARIARIVHCVVLPDPARHGTEHCRTAPDPPSAPCRDRATLRREDNT